MGINEKLQPLIGVAAISVNNLLYIKSIRYTPAYSLHADPIRYTKKAIRYTKALIRYTETAIPYTAQ